MSQTITVLKVDREKQPKGYVKTTVSYRTEDGKTKGMVVLPFEEQKDVAEAFKDAQPNDVFEVAFRKNARDFWEFVPVPRKVGQSTAVTQAEPKAKSGGNWETNEERAARQVYIARQSSLERAIEYFELTKNPKVTKEDVANLANFFTVFVQHGLPVESKDIE